MRKKYKAIFFDWDGTAVLSRRAPADEAAAAMKPLLRKGIRLAIISGTTIGNIAGGSLERFFSEKELQNLYLGLGRGAYNYAFENGHLFVFQNAIPSREDLLRIHQVAFDLHRILLLKYDLPTDIVFSRPNYCKIDLVTDSDRGENLFMQENELGVLKDRLRAYGIRDGLQELIRMAEDTGKQYGLNVIPTCDAKYLEIGVSSKSNNVDEILKKIMADRKLSPADCAYWGDEYVELDAGIFGSDSYMKTKLSSAGDFFDVSEASGKRPDGVKRTGGGVETFLNFLKMQNELA